jgi:DnaK suppressor protein
MDVEQARQRLTSRMQELQAQIRSAEESAAPVELDQSRVGRLSRMDAMQSQAVAAESQRRRRAELTRVRAALARIEAGEWGTCLECGEPIAPRRLELDPSAFRCIECAQTAS